MPVHCDVLPSLVPAWRNPLLKVGTYFPACLPNAAKADRLKILCTTCQQTRYLNRN